MHPQLLERHPGNLPLHLPRQEPRHFQNRLPNTRAPTGGGRYHPLPANGAPVRGHTGAKTHHQTHQIQGAIPQKLQDTVMSGNPEPHTTARQPTLHTGCKNPPDSPPPASHRQRKTPSPQGMSGSPSNKGVLRLNRRTPGRRTRPAKPYKSVPHSQPAELAGPLALARNL